MISGDLTLPAPGTLAHHRILAGGPSELNRDVAFYVPDQVGAVLASDRIDQGALRWSGIVGRRRWACHSIGPVKNGGLVLLELPFTVFLICVCMASGARSISPGHV